MQRTLFWLSRVSLILAVCSLWYFPGLITGQPLDSALPQAQLQTLFPPGGKAGTTFEVQFTGTDLEDLSGLTFSHPGIKAEPIKDSPPKVDPKKQDKNPPPVPKVIKFKVTINPDVPLGLHDGRLISKWGISNPRAFHVCDMPEVNEKEPNNDLPEGQKIELNTVVNGIIAAPTDVDYYTIKCKKGQRILACCLASSIDSRCNPLVEIFDAAGRILSSNKNYDSNDALGDFTCPEDGEYYLRLSQFTYNAGSGEYFYRLLIGAFPWIDAVFPNSFQPGQSVPSVIYGRNLPGGTADSTVSLDGTPGEKLTVNIQGMPALPMGKFTSRLPPSLIWVQGFEHRVKNPAGTSNAVLLSQSDAPVLLEKDDNDAHAKAQKIPFPSTVCGMMNKRNDRDWYSFSGKKGQKVSVRVFAETLGSQADIFLRVVGKDGKSTVTELDDHLDPQNVRLSTNTTDPNEYIWDIQEDADYFLVVASRQAANLFGPRHHYQLRLTPAQENFTLVSMPPANFRPDTLEIPKGGANYLTLFAFREAGMKSEIALKVEGLPGGVKAEPMVLHSTLKQGTFVIRAEETAPEAVFYPRVVGTAQINGKTITREAIPISLTWPVQPNNNILAITRLERGVPAHIQDKAKFNLQASIDKAKIVVGDKGTIKVLVVRKDPEMKNPIQIQPMDMPANFVNNNQVITIAANANEGTVPVTVPANFPPGVYWIVLRGQTNIPYNKDPMAKQKNPVNVVAVTSPVKLTVLPKTLAEFTVANTGVQIKAGQEGILDLRVKRLHDHAGPLRIEPTIPPAMKGLTIEAADSPLGSEISKLKVKVAADAMPGPRNDIILKLKGKYLNEDEIVQELKVNVNVVK